MNPIKYLKKTLVIEMGFAAAPFIGGVAATSAAAGGAAAVGATLAAGTSAAAFAGGAAATSLAATSSLAGAGLFGGSLLSTISNVGSVISTVSSIGSTLAGGREQARDFTVAAKAEEDNARNREIERKRNLIRSLALQNVRSGASGITSGAGSSAQAIQFEDISRFELDQTSDASATTNRINQLKQNASNATNFSLLSAGGEATRFGLRQVRRGSL